MSSSTLEGDDRISCRLLVAVWRCCVALLLLATIDGLAVAEEAPRFPDAVAHYSPPSEPAHLTWFVEEPLPEGGNTLFRDQMNRWVKHFISHAGDPKADRFVQELWDCFGMYVVWGLSSPDSEVRGDPTLAQLLNLWLDDRFPTAPEEAEGREGWEPAIVGSWGAWYLYGPWVEIMARPELRRVVGHEREEKWLDLLLRSARLTATEGWPGLEEKCMSIVNMAAHTMAHFTLGWMLARERDPELAEVLARKAAYIVHMLGWHMHPNGSIRYLYYKDLGYPQLVSEVMYYHNINIRALYAHWWFTGDKTAQELLRKQAPYYRLRIMPWGWTEYHSAIWWKDLWRTFWPSAVALAAVASEDGELVRLALDMAERSQGWDRKFRDWGVHAYKQLALRRLSPQPRADNYIIEDPDIGGLRGRFGGFSFSFSSNSHGRTLAGVLSEGGGLAAAGPLVRIDPLRHNPEWQFGNLEVAGKAKPRAHVLVGEGFGAGGAIYAPHPQLTTWREHLPGPWSVQQLWLYLPDRLIGLMLCSPTEETRARSVEHYYRFFGDSLSAETAGDAYVSEDLRLRIADTNLAHRVVEPARRHCQVLTEPDRQLVLCDVSRVPVGEARGKAEDDACQLLERTFGPHERFYSLVEIAYQDAPPGDVTLIRASENLLAFQCQVGAQTYLAVINFAQSTQLLAVPWSGEDLATKPDAIQVLTRTVTE